jgi:hypothetical protein
MSQAVNPYAAPAAKVEDAGANPEAEAIRQAHISHEASIKAVGFLYYLGAAIAVIFGVGSLAGVASGGEAAGLGAFMLAFGVAGFFVGWGVRGLRRWGQVVGCVMAVFGLLGFPVGTLINGYILYLFLSKKGRTIFSPEYQDVIAATPHVKYRTSILVWIFLAIVLGLLLLAVLVPMFR